VSNAIRHINAPQTIILSLDMQEIHRRLTWIQFIQIWPAEISSKQKILNTGTHLLYGYLVPEKTIPYWKQKTTHSLTTDYQKCVISELPPTVTELFYI
jgi:hypothetical protein